MQVAFQGEGGAYSDAAARSHFGPDVTTVPCESFDDAFKAVADGDVDLALLPFENTLGGSIHRNYDLLQRYDLHVTGEEIFRVQHCLLALNGVALEDIKMVRSHPQALAQCEGFLVSNSLRYEAAYDTAGAAKLLAESGARDGAAIASEYAGQVYGLNILRKNIEDDAANFTRFLVLAREPVTPHGAAKTSLVCTLPHRPGSLFRAMGVFALRDIDLTKIESRPVAGRSWEYLFYMDIIGSQSDLPVQRAIEHLREMAPMVRVFGSYPRDMSGS